MYQNNNTLLDTRILIYDKNKNLKPIKIYRDDQGRKWVEAHNNTKFVIELKNSSYTNYLSVVSVDGLNVITGQEAFAEAQDGYVLNSHDSLKIKGWRTSMEECEFVFTNSRKESYTNKLTGNTENMGVIGVAFFTEIIKSYSWTINYPYFPTMDSTKWDYNKPSYTATCNATYSSDAPIIRSMSMGTKQGQTAMDVVQSSNKEFSTYACMIDCIYYDSRENLIRKGIIKKNNEDELPKPFFNSGKFCPSL